MWWDGVETIRGCRVADHSRAIVGGASLSVATLQDASALAQHDEPIRPARDGFGIGIARYGHIVKPGITSSRLQGSCWRAAWAQSSGAGRQPLFFPLFHRETVASPVQNQELADRINRGLQDAVRQMASEQMRKAMRPGGMLSIANRMNQG
jgi:hypothetical protein